MALARRSSLRDQGLIWPGFVDGLATLLMVIIFVLMVFFLIQINLAQRLLGQDETLTELRLEINELTSLLNMEREENDALSLRRQQLQIALDESYANTLSLEDRLASMEKALLILEEEKLSLLAERDALAADKDTLTVSRDSLEAETARLIAERDLLLEKLAQMQTNIDGLTTRVATAEEAEAKANTEISDMEARLANMEDRLATLLAERDQSKRDLSASRNEILEMTTAMLALQQRLEQLQALLDEKTAEAREAKQVTANLTKQLNEALSNKVVELSRFRSEFFGRLREVLKDRTDITIVGDRFVFQSEVLFELGSADIGQQGEKQLDELASALMQLTQQIPDDIDWVLQVDGHTDNLPIFTNEFSDNWELSTARAVSVVRYLVKNGIDPKRLAANGYGEFQPIDPADTPEARSKNRRIEFKLTRRVTKSQNPS
ncbi:MAG: OmpA family protein [Alphaproteobacteria bacterium]|nr:OmpA family protein [Alphaproteobacteria bacterium]